MPALVSLVCMCLLGVCEVVHVVLLFVVHVVCLMCILVFIASAGFFLHAVFDSRTNFGLSMLSGKPRS